MGQKNKFLNLLQAKSTVRNNTERKIFRDMFLTICDLQIFVYLTKLRVSPFNPNMARLKNVETNMFIFQEL